MVNSAKKWMITAAVFILSGTIIFVAVMTMLNWNFEKLSTTKYKTKTFEFNENIIDVSVNATIEDVSVLPSADGTVRVIYDIMENINPTVKLDKKELVISSTDNHKWFNSLSFGITVKSPKIKIYLPPCEYGRVKIHSATGNISLSKKFIFDDIKLSSSTGDVSANGVICKGDIEINLSTGDTKLSNTACKNLKAESSTGDIRLKGINPDKKLTLKSSTGDIDFEKCDAFAINIKTSTGDVSGSVLTRKIFIAESSTGDISVPESAGNGKCKIKTSTGDINIKIAK